MALRQNSLTPWNSIENLQTAINIMGFHTELAGLFRKQAAKYCDKCIPTMLLRQCYSDRGIPTMVFRQRYSEKGIPAPASNTCDNVLRQTYSDTFNLGEVFRSITCFAQERCPKTRRDHEHDPCMQGAGASASLEKTCCLKQAC